ncbi:hypothetical protein GCM10023321_80130 [Pseudonocardia eucalypti]|uniref:Uncharacterized protein n=1 Tax=Pseudonocardia eucalypti TaxID=648755 RepID=A0ABP9RCA8_9PSEU|nr:hypothetical protein [Pseudonocardia eucalypti]
MATYPPIGDQERDAALARIAARHRQSDDSRWSEAGTEARDVLEYLRRRQAQLPYALAARDVWDELVLSAWVEWDERRREAELLHRALRLGLSLREVGQYLGIGSRQGMRDYLDRLDAVLADHAESRAAVHGPATGDGSTDPLHRWSRSTRAQRGADVHATRARRAARRARPARQTWIAAQHDRIAGVISTLLEQAERIGIEPAESADEAEPGLGDYLSWLGADLERAEFDAGSFGALGLALGELRTHPAVTERAGNHGIHRAIAAVDQLRSDYAELRLPRTTA